MRYDPIANPKGIRGTVYDASKNIYGIDPATGFALRPFDNVGVQYGLDALNAGVIDVNQFILLNSQVGGYDQDANYVLGRTVGDAGAMLRAQQSGLQLGGNGGLASIPVFDISGIYNDDSGYHYQWFHFAQRDRMAQMNGNADNHVMWRGNPVPAEPAWKAFIDWVVAYKADSAAGTQREKVIRNKPIAGRLLERHHLHRRAADAVERARHALQCAVPVVAGAAPGGRRSGRGEHPEVRPEAGATRRTTRCRSPRSS